MTAHYWHDATQHLSKACPIMAGIIANYPGELMQSRGDAFYTLLRSIAGQQISVKAADAVWRKLEARVKPLTPYKILRVRDTTLRACGFSGQKVLYAKNLARYFVEKHIYSPLEGESKPHSGFGGGNREAWAYGEDAPHQIANGDLAPPQGGSYFAALSDEAVIAELTSIKGIGRWTAEMFLIFYLQRPDIFPLQDLGLLKSVERHYNGGEKMSKPALIKAGERFRPYRTVATWYLWRALDPVPVAY